MSGYHGKLETNVHDFQLQKCSTNEIDKEFSLNNQTTLNNDPATSTLKDQQSIGIGNYYLDNMYGCECELKSARDIQLSEPTVNFEGGKGWIGEKGCLIDNDSKLRTNNLTDKRYIHQLKNLQNMGFFGKGEYNVETESVIRQGNSTFVSRPCNILSGSSTLDLSFTPMIDNLQNKIQNTKHIIPEDSMNAWPRGGLPSRQIMKNNDYNNRCVNEKR